ncbi:MAG: hypothetical protein J6W29_09445 [Neisseriaceae bacterium]|nr:hypothetical protein [Neisseriaceae bacterium]
MKKLFVLLSACVLTPAFAQTMCENSVYQAQIAAMNKILPQEIKPNFFMNKITCQGDMIGYEYLVNVSTQNNPQSRRELAQIVQPALKDAVCQQREIHELKRYGIQKAQIRLIDKDHFVLVEDIVPLSSCR